jgi:hypothetical protein
MWGWLFDALAYARTTWPLAVEWRGLQADRCLLNLNSIFRSVESAGTAPSRRSRTRNNRPLTASNACRSPCNHRKTGRRQSASSPRLGVGMTDRSGLIRVASQYRGCFDPNRSSAPTAIASRHQSAARRRTRSAPRQRRKLHDNQNSFTPWPSERICGRSWWP